MSRVPSEGIVVRMAPQPTLGTAPTAEWTQLQIDKGSLQNWKRTLQTVERNIHDKAMVPRKGSVVGWSVSPAFAHDPNKDFMDLIAEPAMRCVGSHPGGQDKRKYRPTAVADGAAAEDSFTVAADGDIPDQSLVYTRGFAEDDNNDLFVTSGTSTTTAIKVATGTLTAEASPPVYATLDVVGFQGAAGDIEIDSDGNIKSTTLDFTTFDIPIGSLLKAGGATAGTRFATNAYNGWAWVVSVAAHLITVEDRTWTVGTADDGDSKTIQVFTSSLYRNYEIDNASYSEKKLYGELEEPKAGSDGSARYTDCEGLGVNTLELSAPLKSKITASVSFIGTDAGVPQAAADRTGGAGTNAGDSPAKAYAPIGIELADTANDLEFVRIMDSGGSMIAEINSWTLTFGNSVSPHEVQGTAGASDLVFGEFAHTLRVEAYYTDDDQTAAASENRDLRADGCVNNGDFAFAWRLPRIAMRNDAKSYDANTHAKLTFDTPAFGHETSNIAGVLCVFGHVPDDSALAS